MSLTRELLRGSTELMILSVLSDGPKYGYLVQKRLREASHGQVDLKAGTLYPLLHRLEDAGAVRCRWEESTGRSRKWYELTATGRRRLSGQAQQWQDYAECIRQLLRPAVPELALISAR